MPLKSECMLRDWSLACEILEFEFPKTLYILGFSFSSSFFPSFFLSFGPFCASPSVVITSMSFHLYKFCKIPPSHLFKSYISSCIQVLLQFGYSDLPSDRLVDLNRNDFQCPLVRAEHE